MLDSLKHHEQYRSEGFAIIASLQGLRPPRGWDSDEEEQAEFIRTYLRLTEDVEPVLSIWAFLYVLPGQPIIFETMTLVRPDGSFPPAWDAWNQGE